MEWKTLYQRINPKKITLSLCSALADRDKERRAVSGASNCLHNTIGQHSDVVLVDGRVTLAVVETAQSPQISENHLLGLSRYFGGWNHISRFSVYVRRVLILCEQEELKGDAGVV